MHYDLHHQIISVITMAIVGYVEEIIFRGFLYKAIEKDNVKQAIIISAATFGAGHIVNLTSKFSNHNISEQTEAYWNYGATVFIILVAGSYALYLRKVKFPKGEKTDLQV